MDNTEEFTAIELCAGYGGIHLGLKRVVPNLRTVAYSEIEAFACANLVAKMEAGLLDAAPIWTDIKTFPTDGFFEKVHLIAGGYPCQPFSTAGQRKGADDSRHLWPHIRRIVNAIRPLYVFWENVEGHVSLGLSSVISDMEEDGYATTWGIFSAAECRAPHQRKRVFIIGKLANAESRCPGRKSGHICEAYGRQGGALPRLPEQSSKGELAHSGGARLEGREFSGALGEGAWGSRPISQCGCIDRWPARPGEPQYEWEPPRVVDDSSRRGFINDGKNDREDTGNGHKVGGASETSNDGGGQTESPLGGNIDGSANRLVRSASRTDELRLLGNGVVPATAALAWKILLEKLETRKVKTGR